MPTLILVAPDSRLTTVMENVVGTVYTSRDHEELLELLVRFSPVDLVVLGPKLSDQIRKARSAASLHPDITVLVVAEGSCEALLNESIGSVSALSGNISCVSLEDGQEALATSIKLGIGAAEERRKFREVVERTMTSPIEDGSQLDYEPAQTRLAFLAEASALLAESLDYSVTLRKLARLAVPYLADWCVVDVLEDDGGLQRVAVEHRDPAKAELAEELGRRYPSEPEAPWGISKVLKTGLPEFYSDVPQQYLITISKDEEHLRMLQEIGLRSAMIVPLIARARIVGAITLVMADSGRIYGAADVTLAEDLARRAALAVDNARLFKEAQSAEQRFHDLVQSIDGIVWEADPHTFEFSFVSQRAEPMFGYPIGRWLKEPGFPREIIHPDDREPSADLYRRFAKEGGENRLDYRVFRADGTLMWVRDILHVVPDRDGNPKSMRGLIVDITDQKRAELLRAVQHSTMRVLSETPTLEEAGTRMLREIGSLLGWQVGMLWTVDDDKGVLRCKADWAASANAGKEFIGVSKRMTFDKGVGLPGRVWDSGSTHWINDVTTDSNFPRAPWALSEGLRGACGFPIVSYGDVLGAMEFFDARVLDLDEELLRTMGTIGRQMGQAIRRRRAEDALRESEAQLQFQRALLHSQSEATIDGILVVSPEGQMVSWNRRFVEMWEMPQVVVDSRSDDAALAYVLEQIADPDAFLARVRYLYDHPDEESRDEITLKDGRVYDRWSAPLKSEAGQDLGRAWYFRDVTDVKRSEERAKFLAGVTPVLLAAFPDYQAVLVRLAEYVVPFLADWCTIDVLEDEGGIERIAVAHSDPEKSDFADLLLQYPPDPKGNHALLRVLRTGLPILTPHLPDSRLIDAARDEEHLRIMRELGYRSSIIIPLHARGKVLGAVSLICAESGRTLTASDLELATELVRRAGIALDNARIAKSLQEGLIPPPLPEIPELELAARYNPVLLGTDVGGDFYEVFQTSDGAWAILIGDVCGKGVEAATLARVSRNTVRVASLEARKPSRVLRVLNDAMRDDFSENRFCTVAYGRVKVRNGGVDLTVSCAGHPPPLVLRADGRVEAAGKPGTLAGIFPDPTLIDKRTQLRSGDSVVFYTDGVTEARGVEGTFGEWRLRALLKSCTQCTAEEIAERIEAAVLQVQPTSPRDDIALVVLRVL